MNTEDEACGGRQRYGVSPERFVDVWEMASSADEVAKLLGMPKAIVHARVSTYRKMGIKLKKMPRSPKNKVDVEALNARIEVIEAERKKGGK
jgi:hypothetical protein